MKKPEKNWLEWAVFWASLALVVATVGSLAVDAFRQADSPPHLRAELGRPERAGGAYRVPVTVVNLGDETAADARVEVVLAAGGREERAGFEVAHVPRRSRRRGWVTFERDPAAGRLTARVVGFEAP